MKRKPLDARTLRWVTTVLSGLERAANQQAKELRGGFPGASDAHGRYAQAYRHAGLVIKARSKPARPKAIEKRRAKKGAKR